MSDFESICSSCDEIFCGRSGPCPKCGSKDTRLYSMDGLTNRQWREMERQEREEQYNEKYTDDEDRGDEDEE